MFTNGITGPVSAGPALRSAEAKHVDTLSFIGAAYRDDIEIEGGCLLEECAELYYGPDADLSEEEQANL